MSFPVELGNSLHVDVDENELKSLVASNLVRIVPTNPNAKLGRKVILSALSGATQATQSEKTASKPGPKPKATNGGAPKKRRGRPPLSDEEKARRKAEREAAKAAAQNGGDSEKPAPKKRGRPRKAETQEA
jgi:hypothetical protein